MRDALAPLSRVLRERTAAAHAEVESSPYMTALACGRVTSGGLAALLGRLVPVYEALERAAAGWRDDVRVGRFVLPELHRSARLRDDLQHLTGRPDGLVTPASAAYAARVEQVTTTSAAAFVAHHYTRCLADLSGGQVVRAALARELGAADGTGASSFVFPGLRPAALAQEYRGWLDAASFTPAEREELVAEVLVAYGLNAALARELDGDLPLVV